MRCPSIVTLGMITISENLLKRGDTYSEHKRAADIIVHDMHYGRRKLPAILGKVLDMGASYS